MTDTPLSDDVVERVMRALADDDLRCSELGMEPASDEWFDSNSRAALEAARYGQMVECLREIVNPIAAMQRRAKAEGTRLSGMAYQIANDPEYIRSKARALLSSIGAAQ